MAGPVFPDVPNVPGVPAVNRLASSRTIPEPPLTGDTITVTANSRDQWGVFDTDGNDVLTPDTILAIGYNAEYRLADFPVEQGAFETYDKVALPFDVRVVMTKGGTLLDRAAFMNTLEELRSDLKLYNVITPERSYLNVNFVHVSVDRSREQGAGLITVEIGLREIRQTVTTEFSKTRDAASADPVSGGSVQAQDVPEGIKSVTDAKSLAAVPVDVPNLNVPPIKQPFFSAASGQALKQVAATGGVPAQVLSTTLGGQACKIGLTQKRTGMFVDLIVNNVPIVLGALARDGVGIVGSAALGFIGDIALVDTQGASDPNYAELGSRFLLLWAGAR